MDEPVTMENEEKSGGHDKVLVLKLVTVCVICLTIIGVLLSVLLLLHRKDKLTVESLNMVLSQQLSDESELVTQSLKYTGKLTRTEGTIPLINKKSITIKYTAEIKAGIDPRKIEVTSVTNDRVTVYIPESEILSQAVDLSSVEILDEDFAVFGDKKSEIMKSAYSEAQENVDKLITGDKSVEGEKLDIEELIEEANEETESMVRGIFKGVIGDRSLDVKVK